MIMILRVSNYHIRLGMVQKGIVIQLRVISNNHIHWLVVKEKDIMEILEIERIVVINHSHSK